MKVSNPPNQRGGSCYLGKGEIRKTQWGRDEILLDSWSPEEEEASTRSLLVHRHHMKFSQFQEGMFQREALEPSVQKCSSAKWGWGGGSKGPLHGITIRENHKKRFDCRHMGDNIHGQPWGPSMERRNGRKPSLKLGEPGTDCREKKEKRKTNKKWGNKKTERKKNLFGTSRISLLKWVCLVSALKKTQHEWCLLWFFGFCLDQPRKGHQQQRHLSVPTDFGASKWVAFEGPRGVRVLHCRVRGSALEGS